MMMMMRMMIMNEDVVHDVDGEDDDDDVHDVDGDDDDEDDDDE